MKPTEEDAIGNTIQGLRSSGKNWHDIELILVHEHQWDAEQVAHAIKQYKKEYHDKHVKAGKTKIVWGIVLLGLNFVISCIHFHADLPFSTIMYGFTTAGIILLLWGAYDCLH